MVQEFPSQATCLLFVGASRRPSFVVEMCRVRTKELGAGEVLVGVRLAGLCPADVSRFVASEGADDECALIPGHEAVGDVIASRRQGVDVGARVVFSSSNWCLECEWCRRGAHVACENITKYGHPPLSSSECELGGTLSSHVLLRAGTAVCPVPPSVSDGHAVLASCPLALALAGILRLTKASFRDKMVADDVGATAVSAGVRPTVLVQGCGLVGILACAVLSESGFRVFCEDTNVTRLRLASKFHALPVFRDAGPLTPSAGLPERLDAVVVAFGSRLDYCDRLGGPCSPLLQGQAGRLLRPGGTLLLLGQPSLNSGSGSILDAADMLRKSICVIGASEYEPDNLKDAVRFLEGTEDKFPYGELLSPAYALSEFQSALTSALEMRFLRVLVRPNC